MASSTARTSQVWLGFATVLALGAASFAFGFDHVGRFCLFATPTLIASRALRKGMFPFVFGRHALIRTTDPRGFWIAIGACVLIAVGELWFFLDGLRLGT